MNKIEQVVSFFRRHPGFPFFYSHKNYDEYCAMYLCLTYVLKLYIPKNQYQDWSFAYDYIDFRRNPDGEVAYPLMCINSRLELVVYLGCNKRNENDICETSFSIQISRDDRWGDRWEHNAPQEEWYNEMAIMFDLNDLSSFEKIDKAFKLALARKQSFDKLCELREFTPKLDD